MKAPLLMRKILLLGIYPSIYIMWVNLMKNTWIQNNLKDLHPQILYPQQLRFTKSSSPFNYQNQMDDCLIIKGQNDIVDEIQKKLSKTKKYQTI